MFNLGPMEMMLVAGIALLLFGKNLPKVARDIGKSITEFKRGINQIEDDVHHASHSQSQQ